MYTGAMSARRPMPRCHHPLASPRGRWRAAHRLAAGLPAAAVARAEQVDPAEIEALLARPDFRELLASCRALAALPEAERLRRLEQIAWCALELAMAEGDWRCAAFVLSERRLGRSPALTLARAVVADEKRAARQPPPEPRPSVARSGPARARIPDPAGAVVRRAAASLRAAVAAQEILGHAASPAAPDDAMPADAAPPVAPPPMDRRPTWPHRLGAASPNRVGGSQGGTWPDSSRVPGRRDPDRAGAPRSRAWTPRLPPAAPPRLRANSRPGRNGRGVAPRSRAPPSRTGRTRGSP
jgi:hypothetical protein